MNRLTNLCKICTLHTFSDKFVSKKILNNYIFGCNKACKSHNSPIYNLIFRESFFTGAFYGAFLRKRSRIFNFKKYKGVWDSEKSRVRTGKRAAKRNRIRVKKVTVLISYSFLYFLCPTSCCHLCSHQSGTDKPLMETKGFCFLIFLNAKHRVVLLEVSSVSREVNFGSHGIACVVHLCYLFIREAHKR